MSMTLELLIHISAGSVALVTGAIGLIGKKGNLAHRQAGRLFVLAMLIMAITGAFIAYSSLVFITVLAGTLSLYLVLSGWLTVRKKSPQTLLQNWFILVLGIAVSILGMYLSLRAYHGVTDNIGSFKAPAFIYYLFTFFALLGVIGDTLLLLKGCVVGKYRIARHVWRMCIPFYIAATSLFDGQQDIFPLTWQGTFYLNIPTYLIMLTMLFWLIKLGVTNIIKSNINLEQS